MITDLLIMRHGKAAIEPAEDDFNREIVDKGKRRAQRMAIWLLQQQLIPDTVVSSPAKRALTTAQKCCKAMGQDARQIVRDRRIYEADVSGLVDVLIEQNASASRLLLVGHNPVLDKLIEYLVGVSQTGGKSPHLARAALAHLRLREQWSQHPHGAATLVQMIHPGKLPKLFPFPTPDSEELRKRPSYYYTQSSVIPYRLQNNHLEILITRSSQNKHWVVPKGIADPGHSLQESAAKEAREEAGVEGKVADDAIGSYQYEKWGATCTVTVYPMQVTRQLSDEEWQEQHRGRQWLPVREAAATVRQKELGELILALESGSD
jgi:phosphohistidine phosphatase